MLTEFGHFALIVGLCVALVQSVVPLIGAARGDAGLIGVGRTSALALFALLTIAMAALMHAYVTSDFSVANVAQNSHTDKPMLYKVTGLWGNHEGSMLLWVFILGLCGGAVAAFSRNLPPALGARVLAIQGMIAAGFLAFILATSNPFARLTVPPANGQGLNPVLQDPGLAFHPPFLYLGYVGFSVSFAFAIAALIDGKVDAAWARWVRPWALAAWCALTLGIALGSWWAYYTLGWGGWWFWDPVENASFMPWLVGTALIHSAIVVEKRDALKSWTILLAIITFSLSLVGTFLVRSGVLTSVHAFAVDPARGSFILALLVLAIGGSLTLYAVRAPALAGGGLFAPISREGSLVLNNLLMATAAGTVLLGTLYPLFLDVIGGDKITVGAPFFNKTFVPLMVPVLLTMAIGPLLGWKRGDVLGALQRLWLAFAATFLVCLAVLYLTTGGPVMASFGFALAAWTGVGAIVEWAERVALFRARPGESLRRALRLPRAAHGMALAHLGIAVTVAGISASAFDAEQIDLVAVGGSLRVGQYDMTLDGIERRDGSNFRADEATVTVRRDGAVVAIMRPQRRFFPLQQRTTSETAIRTGIGADLYIALGDPDAQGRWTIRAYWKPLVSWIWGGALMMAFGGMVSLTDRRWRIGVAVKRRPAPAALPAVGD